MLLVSTGVFQFRFRLPTAVVLLVGRVVLCRARFYDEAELQLNNQTFWRCWVWRRAAKGPLILLRAMHRKSKLESDLCLTSWASCAENHWKRRCEF